VQNKALVDSRFNALLTAAVDGIIIIDETGNIVTLNRAAEILFGYEFEELLGQNISQLMPSPDRENHGQFLRTYLETGERKVIGNGRKTTAQKKDRTLFPIYLSVGQINDTPGSQFVGIIHDLTDQENQQRAVRQKELEVRQLRERLAYVSRFSTMGEMAAGIAHEINQPLTAIATYAQACNRMLSSGQTDTPDLLGALKKINEQTQRASKVLQGIRQLSKKHAIVCKDHNCIQLIREVVMLAQEYIHDKDLQISLEFDGIAESQKVRVDLIQTQQVLLNLINNAIESMGKEKDSPTSSLKIAAEKLDRAIVIKARNLDGTMVEIAVVDHGHGIDQAHQDQLFDAFFTTKPSGLGMGLSICQSIVVAQGGQIYYQPNAQKGSIFAFTLPKSIGTNP